MSEERYGIQKYETAFVSVIKFIVCIWERETWRWSETKVEENNNFAETSRTHIYSSTFTQIQKDTRTFFPQTFWFIKLGTSIDQNGRALGWCFGIRVSMCACVSVCMRVVIFFPTSKHKWLYRNSRCYWPGGLIVKPITVLDFWDS